MKRIGKKNRVVSNRVIASSVRLTPEEGKFFKDLQSRVYSMSKDGVRRDIKIRDIYRDADYGETIYTLICGRNEWTIHRYDDFSGKRNPFAGVYLYTEDDTFSPLAKGRELYDLIPELSGEIAYSSNVKSSTRIGRKSVQASARVGKRPIKTSAKRIRASVNASADPFKLIERSRYGFINEWDEIAEENEATPDTSWNNIFDNALEEFQSYADDEASGFLLDKFRSGEINEGDMLEEFEQFVMFRDLDDFDF